ncbi:MAG: glycosyltransferase family 4 protein [Proteobacteria bacterium]|nr:glycosyltransferase family 4 protein [Pseudomonadota bacterium]
MAQSLIQALSLAGHTVEIASIFRSRDGGGDVERQARLARLGERMADRLIRRYRRDRASKKPDIWFTYHLYYKAPDWIGPAVCDALDIPYVIAEASYAPKRAGGPWDIGHRAAAAAISRANLIIGLNSANTPCVLPLLTHPGKLLPLAPFLDCEPYLNLDRAQCRAGLADIYGLDPSKPWLLTVAMMRDDAKLRSYQLLGKALRELRNLDWQLLVVGDGPARGSVEEALPTERTCYLGEKAAEDLPAIYSGADVFVWPSVNEAYGMATLEAQIAGLPVVSGRSGGVVDIVIPDETALLVETGNASAFAKAVAGLISDPQKRHQMSQRAAANGRTRHSLNAAANFLSSEFEGLLQ